MSGASLLPWVGNRGTMQNPLAFLVLEDEQVGVEEQVEMQRAGSPI
jgi:hypothetical protein